MPALLTEPHRGYVLAMQPRREEFSTQGAARPGAKFGRWVCRGWHLCQEGSALPCRDGL